MNVNIYQTSPESNIERWIKVELTFIGSIVTEFCHWIKALYQCKSVFILVGRIVAEVNYSEEVW